MKTLQSLISVCIPCLTMLWVSCGDFARAATNALPRPAMSVSAGTKRFIVMIRKEANQVACLNEHDIKPSRTFRHAFNGFVADLDDKSVARLQKDPRIASLEEDSIAGCGAQQILPTGVQRIAANWFPPTRYDGSDKRLNVTVAVLDSGIQTDHPDLNVVQSVDFSLYGGPYYPHGTECAGIIGALDNNMGTVGVAPGVRLWSVRILETNNVFYWSAMYSAADYLTAHASEIDVASCSFGTWYGNDNSSQRQRFQTANAAAVSQGVVVVAAAMNDASDIAGPDGQLDTGDDTLPAAFPEVMAVSAIDPIMDQFAGFSNFSRTRHATSYVNSPGAAIDVAAPGVNILTTTTNSGYASFSGTSAACPHVAGLVALYIATHGRATNAAGVYAIRQAIVDSGQAQTQWQNKDTRDPDTNHEPLAVASLSWATNRPEFLSIVKAAAGATLTFTTVTGYTHTVHYVNSIGASNQWASLATTNGTGGIASVQDPTDSAARIYRLALQPPPFLATSFVATNLGTLGPTANGWCFAAAGGVPGPIVAELSDSAVQFPIELLGSRVLVPFLSTLNPATAFSMEVWAKPAQTSAVACPLSSVFVGTSQRKGWIVYQANSALNNGNGFYVRCYNTSGSTAYTAASTDFDVDTNAWYHVVGVFDGSSVLLYVNGRNVATATITAAFRPNISEPMSFGTRSEGDWAYTGDLDEGAFYTNALTAAQVWAHYQAGTNAATTTPYEQVILGDNPAGYWRFNEH